MRLFHFAILILSFGCLEKSNDQEPTPVQKNDSEPSIYQPPALETPVDTSKYRSLLDQGRAVLEKSLASQYQLSSDLVYSDQEAATRLASGARSCGIFQSAWLCEGLTFETLSEHVQITESTYLARIKIAELGEFVLAVELTNPNKLNLFRVDGEFQQPSEMSVLTDLFLHYATIDLVTNSESVALSRLRGAADLETIYRMSKFLSQGSSPNSLKSVAMQALESNLNFLSEESDQFVFETLDLLANSIGMTPTELSRLSGHLYEESNDDAREELGAVFLLATDSTNSSYESKALDALESVHDFVRLQALRSLALVSDLRDSEETSILMRIGDQNSSVALQAYQMGKKFDFSSAHYSGFRTILESNSESARTYAIDLLGDVDEDDSVELLIEFLSDPNLELADLIFQNLKDKTYLSQNYSYTDDHLSDARRQIRIYALRLLALSDGSYTDNAIDSIESYQDQESDPEVLEEIRLALEELRARLEG